MIKHWCAHLCLRVLFPPCQAKCDGLRCMFNKTAAALDERCLQQKNIPREVGTSIGAVSICDPEVQHELCCPCRWLPHWAWRPDTVVCQRGLASMQLATKSSVHSPWNWASMGAPVGLNAAAASSAMGIYGVVVAKRAGFCPYSSEGAKRTSQISLEGEKRWSVGSDSTWPDWFSCFGGWNGGKPRSHPLRAQLFRNEDLQGWRWKTPSSLFKRLHQS